MKLANRALGLKPSATMALAAKAEELKKQGKEILALTLGEPDWPTLPSAVKAAHEAIDKGLTRYTPAAGIPAVREEVAKRTSASLKVNFTANQVSMAAGAKFAITACLQLLINPGDEVIFSAPYWVSYPAMVDLCGGVSVIVPTDEKNSFKLLASELKKSITSKTKMIILCSPNNPTGIIYTHAELREIADVLEAHPNVWILTDDIYNELVFNGDQVAPHILHVAPQLKERVLVVNGASKSFAMTGWRSGWVLAPAALSTAIGHFLTQTTSNICSISQYATLGALLNGQSELAKVIETLIERKRNVFEKSKKFKFFKFHEPQGAFYFWVDVRSFKEKSFKGVKLASSKIVAEVLLSEFGVSLVPGEEFGTEGFLRFSFAASMEVLEKALIRFQMLEEGVMALNEARS